MSRSSLPQLARLATAALVALVIVAGFGSSASAGGWAIGSIDSAPDAKAGHTVDVGFTILQHGVTPVDLADDVGVEIVLVDGVVEFFPATNAGATGRYVSEVTFPAAPGDYSWNLRMGWFGTHQLGTLDVASASTGDESGTWTWAMARWVTLGLAGALAAAAAAPGFRPGQRGLTTGVPPLHLRPTPWRCSPSVAQRHPTSERACADPASEHAEVSGCLDRGLAVADAELAVDRSAVGLDRVGRHVQLGRDVAL